MTPIISDNIAFLPASGASVWFSQPSYAAFQGSGSEISKKSREPLMTRLITELNVAPWGEDNRFPQNIAAQLDYCGVAKAGLDWKARALWGQGFLWGKVVGYEDGGKTEIFEPATPGQHPELEQFMRENGNLFRFYLEHNIDWVTFANCFPELVLSKDGKKVKRLVHQESCDCRFRQMDDKGRIRSVLLSKLWSQAKDQFVRFDPRKALATSAVHGPMSTPRMIDNKYMVERRALDPYNALEDLHAAVAEGHRNVILPVQYPSANKTYYQLATWDGARLSGWLEIASKIPAMLKALYEKAFNIKYHIEVPESYFEKRYKDAWHSFKPAEKDQKRLALAQQMDQFLSGAENAHKAFLSYFDVDREGNEVGRIKITVIDNKNTIDKDLIASAAANSEILFAMQINPDLIGAGTPGGAYAGSAGSGSNIREAYLVYAALLNLERQIILEPLRLVQQYNGWDPDLVFRFRDVVLTVLSEGSGSKKTVS